VTPNVYIQSNGNVIGLIEPLSISVEDAETITSDIELFDTFVADHADRIVKAEFVMMVIPIDGSHRAFPICCIPTTHATATPEMLEFIMAKVSDISHTGIDIRGIATDGDRQYLKFSMRLLIDILANIRDISQMKVSEILANFCETCHFSDPYHLVKRDRYRKISTVPYIIDPWDASASYSRDALVHLGIPEYLLSQEQARKMEDSLPLKLFTTQTLQQIHTNRDYGLFFAMLPSTLLLESIHSESLTRMQRIESLMIGASILIMYELYKKVLREHDHEFADQTYTVIPSKHECFTTAWCAEYISLAFSTVSLIYSEETLHLGACVTHILEHYFGAIRRHSQGEATHA
jgi:hypothetical protein